ncbi:MAG: hypothetical protein ACE5JU_17840, partial [Candidatus Binatia bacterium]
GRKVGAARGFVPEARLKLSQRSREVRASHAQTLPLGVFGVNRISTRTIKALAAAAAEGASPFWRQAHGASGAWPPDPTGGLVDKFRTFAASALTTLKSTPPQKKQREQPFSANQSPERRLA